MLAKVTGALSVAGETSPITGISSRIAPFTFGEGKMEKDIKTFCTENNITAIKGFKMVTGASFTIGFYKIVIDGKNNQVINGWSIDSTTGTSLLDIAGRILVLTTLFSIQPTLQ